MVPRRVAPRAAHVTGRAYAFGRECPLLHLLRMKPMNDELEARIRSGQALSESMGNFHVTGWDAEHKTLKAAFTVRREY